MSRETPTNNAPVRPRWDVVVRLTHWGIVIAIVGNALVTEEGSGAHIWVGYGLAALLVLRLLWGFIGTREARFTAFPPSPRAALAHIRELARGRRTIHASHNPLGALNVYAIWACLAVIVGSGIAMAGSRPFDARNQIERSQSEERRERAEIGAEKVRAGISSDTESRAEDEGREGGKGTEGGEAIEKVHETMVYLLYLLIALHLGGVLFETRRNGHALVARMMPGRS